MPKARIRRYRRRPVKTSWLTLENISLIKQFFVTVGPIVVAVYLWVIPQIDARAAEYVRAQFVAVGMDPATLQAVNKNLADLQSNFDQSAKSNEKLSSDVQDLKSQLGTVLELMKLQALKGEPQPITEPVK